MIPMSVSANSTKAGPEAIAVISRQSPYIFAFPFSQTGAGAKSANPASIPATTAGGGVTFPEREAPNGRVSRPYLFTATTSTPFINLYRWQNSTGTIGTKASDPSTLPTAAYGVSAWPYFGSDLEYTNGWVSLATNATPYIHMYSYSTTLGFQIDFKASNPSTLPTGSAWDTYINAEHVGVIHSTTPFISVYNVVAGFPVANPSFGTKINDPASPASTTGGGSLMISNSKNHIFAATSASPRIHAWSWSSTATGFGTKSSNPSTLPTGSAWAMDMTDNESHIGVVHDTTPFLSVYQWTAGDPGTFGTRVSNPSTLPIGNGYGISFTPNKLLVTSSGSAGGVVRIYEWDGSTIGTALSSPSGGPTDNTYAVAYKPATKLSLS